MPYEVHSFIVQAASDASTPSCGNKKDWTRSNKQQITNVLTLAKTKLLLNIEIDKLCAYKVYITGYRLYSILGFISIYS